MLNGFPADELLVHRVVHRAVPISAGLLAVFDHREVVLCVVAPEFDALDPSRFWTV
jgi:hypothetical protein